MLYSKQRSPEDRLIELLISSPYQIKKLHERLQGQEASLSLRAVYKAVNQLIKAGVLLKVGKVVRVDEEWVRSIRKQLVPSTSLQLAVGERMTHSFTSIAHLDAFWTTIVFQLEELEKDGQVFFYNPHNFWIHVPERREAENTYYAHFTELKLHAFYTLGGDSAADKEFKKQYQNEYLQIDTRSILVLPRTDHITVMGDFVITVRIAKPIARQIDELYASNKSSKEFAAALDALCKKGFSSRFVLEHNPLKAQKLRKLLSRNFYFQ
jgi:hypothetical protein